jgi:hypothetical protein
VFVLEMGDRRRRRRVCTVAHRLDGNRWNAGRCGCCAGRSGGVVRATAVRGVIMSVCITVTLCSWSTAILACGVRCAGSHFGVRSLRACVSRYYDVPGRGCASESHVNLPGLGPPGVARCNPWEKNYMAEEDASSHAVHLAAVAALGSDTVHVVGGSDLERGARKRERGKRSGKGATHARVRLAHCCSFGQH